MCVCGTLQANGMRDQLHEPATARLQFARAQNAHTTKPKVRNSRTKTKQAPNQSHLRSSSVPARHPVLPAARHERATIGKSPASRFRAALAANTASSVILMQTSILRVLIISSQCGASPSTLLAPAATSCRCAARLLRALCCLTTQRCVILAL